jgi:hypothetical protein
MERKLVFAGVVIAALLGATLLVTACPTDSGEPTHYTVTFTAGAGAGTPPAQQEAAPGTAVTLPEQGEMTAPEYHAFAGWETGGQVYAAGDSFTVTANTEFAAQWKSEIDPDKTYIRFNNLEQHLVIIYSDPSRQTEIVRVPAEGTSLVEAEPRLNGMALYLRFLLTVEGISIPYDPGDPDALIVRVDGKQINTISIPALMNIETPYAYVKIENAGTSSFTFNQGDSELIPLGAVSNIVMPGETAAYQIESGDVSLYSFMRNTNVPLSFPAAVKQFNPGVIYIFTYTGSALTLRSSNSIMESMFKRFTTVSNAAEMEAALALFKSEKYEEWTIALAGSFSLNMVALSRSDGSAVLTITSEGTGEKTLILASLGIGNGISLVLEENVTLEGLDKGNHLVQIASGGSFTMKAGSKVHGNTGGGVSVSNDGTFTMSGGEINGNSASYGGGVYVNSGGTFTMSGGEIAGNTVSSSYGGGGVYVYSGTFTMSGGEISGNSSSSYGGGVFVNSGGTFTKQSGGVIYGPNAGSLSNSANSGGQAVRVSSGRERNSTAGVGVLLDSRYSGSAGGWE